MTPEQQIESVALSIFETTGRDMVQEILRQIAVDAPPSSKPGEVPHRRTGDLSDGIDYLVTRQGGTVTLEVVSAAPYSEPLEFGAPSRNLAPRPFMRPALDLFTPILIQRLQDAFSLRNQPMTAPDTELGQIFGIEIDSGSSH